MGEGKRISVKIDKLGRPTVEAIGFNGVGCTSATQGLEQALAGGNGVDVREYKPEHSNVEAEQERLHW
jgi:hypothetical protein